MIEKLSAKMLSSLLDGIHYRKLTSKDRERKPGIRGSKAIHVSNLVRSHRTKPQIVNFGKYVHKPAYLMFRDTKEMCVWQYFCAILC